MPDATSPASAPRSEALPRARVIRRRTVFEATRNKGRRLTNRCFALNYLRRDQIQTEEPGTVAFLTPKRLGDANKRTQLRRRMREIYRRFLALPGESVFLIWIARPPAVELSFEELKTAMTDLRKRLR